MTTHSRIIGVLVFSVAALACTWVKPTDEGQAITLVEEKHVELCTKLGQTTSSVKDKVGFLKRGGEKVGEELLTLAKNQAAKMGGDTLVAIGDAVDGSQTFAIFNCAK